MARWAMRPGPVWNSRRSIGTDAGLHRAWWGLRGWFGLRGCITSPQVAGPDPRPGREIEPAGGHRDADRGHRVDPLYRAAAAIGAPVPSTSSPPTSPTVPMRARWGTALWVAAGLARSPSCSAPANQSADERHHGVVTAIALEAVVKLAAFVRCDCFVSGAGRRAYGHAGAHRPCRRRSRRGAGLAAQARPLDRADPGVRRRHPDPAAHVSRSWWSRPRTRSACMSAGWAFPAYLFVMSLFVLPIAVMGRELLPAGRTRTSMC